MAAWYEPVKRGSAPSPVTPHKLRWLIRAYCGSDGALGVLRAWVDPSPEVARRLWKMRWARF